MPLNTTVTTYVPRESDQLFLLIVGDGVLATEPLPSSGQLSIGRAPECDVRIDDASISRNHAILDLDSPMSIIDNASANGSWIADRRLVANSPTPIKVDQAIRLGTVMIIVQRRAASTPPARRLRTHEYFESRLEDECDRNRPFAIVHIIGEDSQATRQIAASTLTGDDVIASYAPGELELLLLGDATRGLSVERTLEAAFAAHTIDVQIGSAACPRDGREPHVLVARARSRAEGQVLATGDGDVVVADDRMRSLHDMIAQVAQADISVLLQGETGVGKEVFAETIHRRSSRADKPFLKLNCAALQESLLESELFGYERGAFTGANQAKAGLLEVAAGGVVFLDEIGELLPNLQAKLLRVLDEKKLIRVGGLSPRAIDIRIVSATNRDLDADVRAGLFRRDLLYRLNTFSILIPPLRDRSDEVLPLAGKFAASIASRTNRPIPRFTDAAVAMLAAYSWPGNIRELRNVIERAMVLAVGNTIDTHDLPEERMRASVTVPDQPTMHAPPRDFDSVEKQRILEALETCAGNQTHAATMLGISRRTLINKLDKFALPRPRKR